MTDGALPALLRRDRAVVLSGLAAVVVLAWAYLLFGAGIKMEMMDMGGGQMMAMPPEWTLGYGALIFVMWAVMMVAMMLPSAALDRQRSTASARNRACCSRPAICSCGPASAFWRPSCNGGSTRQACCRKRWRQVIAFWPAP